MSQKQQYVKWFPLQDQSPRPNNINIGIHESEKSTTTKPILSEQKLIEKLAMELRQQEELQKQKTKFDELNQMKKDRIPIEERITQPKEQPQEKDHSLLIEQIRKLVIGFDEMLDRVLKPDYPEMRSMRKKYVEETARFQSVGFREYIRAIKIKVDSLCSFEGIYDKAMFDMEENEGWFDKKVNEAINQKNFGSAQEVVSSVTQIIMQDEIVMHRRKILSKMK